MTIPEVRDRMRAIADELRDPLGDADVDMIAAELEQLADALRRRRSRPHAPTVSRNMTPELAQEIRDYAATHPTETELAIGVRFGVNQGRVSESLRGKRK